jgi:virulence factor
MIRLGLVDFDTSHVVEFTRRLNHVDIAEDQWVEGARVVAGVPGRSVLAPEKIPGYYATIKKYGVPLFDDPADLFGKVDAVLIESVDGSVHLERARPFLERGMPTYVDKPFACSTADAKAMLDLAARTHAPMMSSSSLRYAPEVVEAKGDGSPAGAIVGAATYGPAPLDPKGRNPGLFHYGIHPVEMLYTLMGPGCRRLTCLKLPDGEVVTGVWADDRLGTVRGIRRGNAAYGFNAFGTKGVASRGVSTTSIYRELLKQIVKMFETKEPPIDPRETLEIVAFIEAALRSAEAGGGVVEVKA